MPFCGFHIKMVKGLVIFSEGLFQATLERANENGMSIEDAYRHEVEELGTFLEALENEYQRVKRSSEEDRTAVMRSVAEWVGDHDDRGREMSAKRRGLSPDSGTREVRAGPPG